MAGPVRGEAPLAGPYGGTEVTSPDLGVQRVARRGTTNGNARGGSRDRQRRRQWLVDTYRADRDALVVRLGNGSEIHLDTVLGQGQPACRCYRCGRLLTVETVTVDRIVPGCQGGTYRRDNIRPACGPCNSSTGAKTRRAKRKVRTA
jgi:5-methylcytosine-specific restriction endonuclease McrA